MGTVVAALTFSSAAGASATGSLSFTTDSSWTANGASAAVISPSCYAGYGAWTTALGYHWIGTSSCAAPPPETDTYSKTFSVPGTPTSGSISIAADNEVTLSVNGSTVLAQSDGYNNFHLVTTLDISSYLQSGSNTIDAVVTNTGTGLSVTGVVAQVSVNYNLPDTTAPSDAPDAPSGWSNADATVNWNWSDGDSGIDPNNCPQSSTSSGEGAILLTSSCSDLAGNTNSDSATVYVDKSGPTDAPVYLSGWSKTDATVEWNWSDSASGIDPSNCTQSSMSTGEGAITLSSTCTDLVGNSSSDSVTVQVDKTAPADAPAGPSGWTNTDATVNWNWTDGGSGIDAANCPQSTTSSGEGTITLSSSCSDVAGNSSSDTATVKVDKTAPVVSYTGGGTYTVDQNVSVTCHASDTGGSGLAADTCANVSGAAWSLGLGQHDLSATASDNAGNNGSGSTSYTVKADTGSVCALVNRWAKNAGQANSLCVKLNAAAAAAARGQTKTHDNNIDAFDNEVRAQSGKGFTAAQAALLIQFASTL